MTVKMWENKVNRNALVLRDVPDQYKTVEMCEIAVSDEPLMLRDVPDRWRDWCLCEEDKQEIEKLW